MSSVCFILDTVRMGFSADIASETFTSARAPFIAVELDFDATLVLVLGSF